MKLCFCGEVLYALSCFRTLRALFFLEEKLKPVKRKVKIMTDGFYVDFLLKFRPTLSRVSIKNVYLECDKEVG